MRNKKKILLLVVIFITIISVGSININKNDKYGTDRITLFATHDAIMKSNYSDSEQIEENAEIIALVSIDSIDGVSNKNGNTNTLVYTYGTATVLNVLKGNINKNEISFARVGGTMSFDEWILGEDNPEKILYYLEKEGLSSNDTSIIDINSKFENDIDIEVGKKYLVYLSSTEENFNDIDYTIIGFQYGLREVEMPNITTFASSSNLLVKNNDTGEWEHINNVISNLNNNEVLQ